MGEHEEEIEASTSLNRLHERLVDLSEEYLHYEIADDYADFEGFSAYARTCLVEMPGQVAGYLYRFADEVDDDRLRSLASDIRTYQMARDESRALADKAVSCIGASKAMSSPAPRPLPARTAFERS